MMQATRLAMPPEWDRHELTVISWPTLRHVWGDTFEQARDEYAATARAIARFEPVLMLANSGEEVDAARRCGSKVTVISVSIDDSWMRDSGPISPGWFMPSSNTARRLVLGMRARVSGTPMWLLNDLIEPWASPASFSPAFLASY